MCKALAVDRIELCQSLSEGGITPSYGLIKAAMAIITAPPHPHIPKVSVILRPRRGDFLYSEDEVNVLVSDVGVCRELGVHGISVGVLTKDGDIDEIQMQAILNAAGPLEVTFHRAFDMTRDLIASYHTLTRLHIHRVLTSGAMPTAIQGSSVLSSLHRISQQTNGPAVVAAAGVTPDNVTYLLNEIGLRHIHGSGSMVVGSGMRHRNDCVGMAAPSSLSEYEHKKTSHEKIAEIQRLMHC